MASRAKLNHKGKLRVEEISSVMLKELQALVMNPCEIVTVSESSFNLFVVDICKPLSLLFSHILTKSFLPYFC